MVERRNNTWTIGRLVLTTMRQSDAAPIVDDCTVRSAGGWTAGGVAIRAPRLRDRGHLHRTVVVAWIGRPSPSTHRLRCWPVIGVLFGGRMRGIRRTGRAGGAVATGECAALEVTG